MKTKTKDAEKRQKSAEAETPARLTAGAEVPALPDRVLSLSEMSASEKATGSVSTFTLLGRHLPIGYLHGGRYHRGFSLRPFKMKEERAIEAIKSAKKGISLADFVAEVLSKMLTSLGPWADFGALSEAERTLIIGQMFLADVLYVYVQLRIEAIGKEIAFDLKCPSCAHGWRWDADLGDTDVVVAETGGDLLWRHDLRDPLKLAKGETKALILQPPRWHAMSAVRPSKVGSGDVKLNLIASSIRCPVEFPDYALSTADLEDLSKYDLEKLTREIDHDTPGPDFELKIDCVKCGNEFSHSLNWNYDFFFGASSL